MTYGIKVDDSSCWILTWTKSLVVVKNISEINKKFVLADTGKSDIIYCGSKNDDGEFIEPEYYLPIIPMV